MLYRNVGSFLYHLEEVIQRLVKINTSCVFHINDRKNSQLALIMWAVNLSLTWCMINPTGQWCLATLIVDGQSPWLFEPPLQK